MKGLRLARISGSLAVTASLAGLLALVAFAFSVGRYPVKTGDLVRVLAGELGGPESSVPEEVRAVVLRIRGPRILAALAVGAALAAAGAAYQGLFRNPLVSPDVLGVSSGAAVGAAVAIFASLPVLWIQIAAFAGGLATVAAVQAIAAATRRHEPILTLVLAGVSVGALLGSVLSLLKYLADPYRQLPAITYWLLGSFTGVTATDLTSLLPLVALGLVPLLLLRWRVNLLTLPADEAESMGVRTGRLRLVVVSSATLITAASVATAGTVGWVGLLVPHLARLLVGPGYGRLLPVSALVGAAYLLGIDTLSRTVAPMEIPPGVLTSFIGTPVFIWLLARSRRAW